MSACTPNIRATCFCIVAFVAILFSSGADAQDKAKIAVVNPGRLLQEYKYSKQAQDDLTKKQNDVLTELQAWDQHRYLGEADQSALADIAIKESNKVELTVADKAAKTKIENASKLLFDEYLALQTRQSPTPADQDRLKELSRLDQDTTKRIKDRQARVREELQKQADQSRARIDKDVRDGIEKVAKEKGFTQVFSSEVLLYCDTDITDEVLKKINSNK